MHLFISRTIAILDLVHALYPSNSIFMSSISKPSTLSVSALDPCLPFLEQDFKIDCQTKDPHLFELLCILLRMGDLFVDSLNQSSEQKINGFINALKQCDEIEKIFTTATSFNEMMEFSRLFQGNITKSQLRLEILECIHYFGIILRKSLEDALHSACTLAVLEILEQIYSPSEVIQSKVSTPNAKPKVKPIVKTEPSTEKDSSLFYAQLENNLFQWIAKARLQFLSTYRRLNITEVFQHIETAAPVRINDLKFAEILSKKLISKIQSISQLQKMLQDCQGKLIKHFYQDFSPHKYLVGPVCVGAGMAWGKQLEQPKKPRDDQRFLTFSTFLQSLKQKKYPVVFQATYAWLGEPILHKKTFMFHNHFTRLASLEKFDPANIQMNTEGSNVAQKVLERFKKLNTKDGIQAIQRLGVTFLTLNKEGSIIANELHKPHFILIAKRGVSYHILDAEFAEFTALQNNFVKCFHSYIDFRPGYKHYNRFTLHPLDDTLKRTQEIPLNKSVFQLLAEQRERPVISVAHLQKTAAETTIGAAIGKVAEVAQNAAGMPAKVANGSTERKVAEITVNAAAKKSAKTASATKIKTPTENHKQSQRLLRFSVKPNQSAKPISAKSNQNPAKYPIKATANPTSHIPEKAKSAIIPRTF